MNVVNLCWIFEPFLLTRAKELKRASKESTEGAAWVTGARPRSPWGEERNFNGDGVGTKRNLIPRH